MQPNQPCTPHFTSLLSDSLQLTLGTIGIPLKVANKVYGACKSNPIEKPSIKIRKSRIVIPDVRSLPRAEILGITYL